MSAEPMQDRFAFPIPNDKHRTVMARILALMKDGQRRSKKEIRTALNLDADTEITARIRDLRKPEYGAWAFNDARADGPDEDGVYRYVLHGPRKVGE